LLGGPTAAPSYWMARLSGGVLFGQLWDSSVSDLERSCGSTARGSGSSKVGRTRVGPEFGALMEVEQVRLQSRDAPGADGCTIETARIRVAEQNGDRCAAR